MLIKFIFFWVVWGGRWHGVYFYFFLLPGSPPNVCVRALSLSLSLSLRFNLFFVFSLRGDEFPNEQSIRARKDRHQRENEEEILFQRDYIRGKGWVSICNVMTTVGVAVESLKTCSPRTSFAIDVSN